MKVIRNVVIVSAVRTPYGKFGGALKDMGLEMGALCFKEAVKRVNVEPKEIEEIALGSANTFVFENVAGPAVAKCVAVKAGFPVDIPTLDTERACCASNAAIQTAVRAIKSEEANIYLAGGIEYLSGMPFALRGKTRWGNKLGHLTIEDPAFSVGYAGYDPVAKEVGDIAIEYGISREEQDHWALRSHQKAFFAQENGLFDKEIVSIVNYQIPGVKEPVTLEKDESIRPNSNIEKLGRLRTIYESPTITPGNAPGLNDGAAVMLLMDEETAKARGLKPLATIINCTTIGAHPKEMALTPAYAMRKALERVNMTIDDMDLIEINEAFAAVTLISLKEIADRDEAKYERLKEKCNVNGGAVAIGHPVGTSGARIIMTLAYELRRRGGGYGIASICGGMGHGDAHIIKVDAD